MPAVRVLSRSLSYYWRTNLAVVAGVAAATAVIVGALVVGDSVHDSLRRMSLERLGGVDAAWTGQRFVRQQLAAEIDVPEGVQCAPAIALPGSLTRRDADGGQTRAGHVNVYGVEGSLWALLGETRLAPPEGNQAVLNRRTAAELGAEVGDEVSLLIEIPPSIPRDSLLGDRDQTVTELAVRVAAVAEDADTHGRFGLNPSQQLPANIYVSLATLQQQLGLSEVRPTRRSPTERPARINALFFGAAGSPAAGVRLGEEDALSLTKSAARALTLADLGLRLTPYEDRGYFALESEQLILENDLAAAGRRVADQLGSRTSPAFVYLINQLGVRREAEGENETGYSMYSVAAGIEFNESPPFGPFEYLAGGPPGGDAVATGGVPVVINEWLARDLAAAPGELLPVGSEFPVRYHVVGDRGELPEEERRFVVAGVATLSGPAADRGFTPQVPGVTDVESYSDWREPFPLDHDAITERDDEYWETYRATPKVFLPLAEAQRLWESRYGELTSLRIASPAGTTLAETMAAFESRLLAGLAPGQTGLIVQPVKAQGLAAASGTTDFTGLFAGFSLFLIAAAMLLIALLFRLGVDRRVQELGLLAAVGFTPGRVGRMMLVEGLLIAAAGALLGLPLGVAYAGAMIYGLKTWWNQAIGTRFLFLSVHPGALAAGALAGVVVALMAMGWALRRTRRIAARDLLHGAVAPPDAAGAASRRRSRARWTAMLSLSIAGLLLVLSLAGALPADEAFAGLSWQVVGFFAMGMAALVGTLALLGLWLASDTAAAVEGAGTLALARLGLRNAARHRGRSLLTAALIASAAFVIVAVACGQRDPQSEEPRRDSGNGGFLLVARSSQPVLYDLNTPEGRVKLRLEASSPAEQSLLSGMSVAPFRMRAGEDASCLNLYQTRLPTILGVPPDVLEQFDREGRFRFANTPGEHPWLRLQLDLPSGRIPVLGDLNTLTYSLKLGLGDSLEVPAAALSGSAVESADLEVVGMLDGSIFQGLLLMSQEHFQQLFPREAGFRYFLVESPGDAAALTRFLESQLDDAGFDAEPVAARLADFLAVQNTYLSTFQTLGGLGLLLGTLGLATVMFRNVLERRSELALLRAIGFRPSAVLQLLWWENAFLLAAGLAAGTASALLAMQPHLASSGGAVPWGSLAMLLAAVLAVGMLAPLAAAREALRTSILSSLRSE
jgi:ABC-type antimicrobial peptide transport system permease subunit